MKLIIEIDEKTYNKFKKGITDIEGNLTVRKAVRNATPLQEELEEIKDEIINAYDFFPVPYGSQKAIQVINKHINKADCDNDCEHCERVECPKE